MHRQLDAGHVGMVKNSEHDVGNGSRFTDTGSRFLWYVIQTKPLEEDLVRRRLEHADFTVFHPRIRTAVRGAKSAHMRVKSLFPSYLFARLDLTDANVFRLIKYTRGVRKIVGSNQPVPIPDIVVETIRARTGEGDVLEQQMVFKQGERVRIKSGWMKDLVGVLEKPVSAAGRVKVLLDIVNKCVKLEMSSANIEKL